MALDSYFSGLANENIFNNNRIIVGFDIQEPYGYSEILKIPKKKR
jgi:hypothetical protein|tara:strand:+ start:82 stop:216 length:135 start_codon:yes stop_codon:yes gene_type:complete